MPCLLGKVLQEVGTIGLEPLPNARVWGPHPMVPGQWPSCPTAHPAQDR